MGRINADGRFPFVLFVHWSFHDILSDQLSTCFLGRLVAQLQRKKHDI